MSDAPPAGCEVCAAGPLVRVLYPVAVHFKGSGFYSTDYGKGGRKKERDSKDGASKDGASKDGDGGSGSSGGDSGGRGDSGDKSGGDKSGEKKKAAEA